jgi:hypothetical protein
VDRHASPTGLPHRLASLLLVRLAVGKEQHHARGLRAGALLEAIERGPDARGEIGRAGPVEVAQGADHGRAVRGERRDQIRVAVEIDHADPDVALRGKALDQADGAPAPVVLRIGAQQALRGVEHQEEIQILHAAEDRGASLHLDRRLGAGEQRTRRRPVDLHLQLAPLTERDGCNSR